MKVSRIEILRNAAASCQDAKILSSTEIFRCCSCLLFSLIRPGVFIQTKVIIAVLVMPFNCSACGEDLSNYLETLLVCPKCGAKFLEPAWGFEPEIL